MRTKGIFILAVLSICAMNARAQGVVTPPVTSFNPDTSMPSVKVPEFIITGKTQVELPKTAKPTIEIDSTYFQDKALRGVGVGIPLYRDIGRQNLGYVRQQPGLFARASIGHYTTTNYLLSGTDYIGGFNVNGALVGNYTAGFIPNTMRRDFKFGVGISKDVESENMMKSSNSMNFDYTRSSYSLYGGPQPNLGRSTEEIGFGVNSDMYPGEMPLAFNLDFNRFSINDSWHNTQSALKLGANTQVQIASGWLGFDGGFLFGNHTLTGSESNQVPAGVGLDRSEYDLRLRGDYRNSVLLGDLSFSVGLTYYQYRDDSSSNIAKLYPDVRADYRLSPGVSLFASFNGSVREATLARFISTDRFVDGSLPLVNTQNNADFTIGSRIALMDDLVVIPQIGILSAKYYPIFFSDSANTSKLMYAGKAAFFSASVTARYVLDRLSTNLTLRYQRGTADSLSSIPNLPGLDANLGAAYRITPRLTARARLLFLSSRYSDLNLANKLASVGLLSLRLAYDFRVAGSSFQIFAGGDNILNERYFIWQGYREFPLTLYVGLSSKIL